MSKTTTLEPTRPETQPETLLRVQLTGKSAGEFHCVIYDLSRESDEADRRELAELLETRMVETRNRLTLSLPISAATEPALRTLVGELWHWGDPNGGWLECLRFRCRPFQRVARVIGEALTAWDGKATWVNDCGTVERSDDPAYHPLIRVFDHWTRLA